MCVCDLSFKCVCAIWEGYISNPPARGWSSPYRRHLPLSPRHLVTLFTWSPCSPGHLVTWSPGHLFTWSPGYLFTSGHLVAWLPCCLVTWSRCAVICSRLRVFHLRAHLFDLPCFPIRPRQIHSLLCASASFHSRFNPYFPCPDFTDSMHFLSRIFFFELLTLTKRALAETHSWEFLRK